MRLLDRLFGALEYPLDYLLPSAAWIAACAAALLGLWLWARRRGIERRSTAAVLALAAALINALVWTISVATRSTVEGGPAAWLSVVEGPFSAARAWLDAALWNTVGVLPAVEPSELFRGYSSWNGHWSVLVARLLNECAAIALAVFALAIAAAAWRAARK